MYRLDQNPYTCVCACLFDISKKIVLYTLINLQFFNKKPFLMFVKRHDSESCKKSAFEIVNQRKF